jgi:Thiamine pyrophosphate-requiring enzymes [acetolactate synthase, pyruvate dehydrogenase (cytochrome), glyoxylate carboligase, phosphonopyruvate decarboxylase]
MTGMRMHTYVYLRRVKPDLLIMLGSSFPFTEFLLKGIPTIQVDIEPANLGKRMGGELSIVSTVEKFLLSVKPEEKQVLFKTPGCKEGVALRA